LHCEPSLLAVLRCFISQESRNNILYFLVAQLLTCFGLPGVA
jgi:hypothetical protein